MNRFDYASRTIPEGYQCSRCAATSIKLWRRYNTATQETNLWCAYCAGEVQGISVATLDQEGKIPHPSGTGRIDQIGELPPYFPAIPTSDTDDYWVYGGAPEEAVIWWRALPSFTRRQGILLKRPLEELPPPEPTQPPESPPEASQAPPMHFSRHLFDSLVSALEKGGLVIPSPTVVVNEPYEGGTVMLVGCEHQGLTSKTMKGGEGPDEAAALVTCRDCGAYRWRFLDGSYGPWRTPTPTQEAYEPPRILDDYPLEVMSLACHGFPSKSEGQCRKVGS